MRPKDERIGQPHTPAAPVGEGRAEVRKEGEAVSLAGGWPHGVEGHRAAQVGAPGQGERDVSHEYTVADLKPCPFCGEGFSEITLNGRVWLGTRYGEPVSVSVRHWCQVHVGQPNRMIERVGRDRASAVAAWNMRAMAQQWIDGLVVTLVREGVNKHRAREIAAWYAHPPAAPPAEDESERPDAGPDYRTAMEWHADQAAERRRRERGDE